MTDGRVSQFTVRSLTEGDKANVSQLAVRSVYGFPSEAARVSQFIIRSLDEPTPPARVSQLLVRAIIRGRIENPTVRAWTFNLDGHDFYVLRLGDTQTLVYDTYSKQWMDWADLGSGTWRANYGMNWLGGQALAIGYGSDVVAGDDNLGLLWFLSPEQPFDGNADVTGDPIYFDRITMGQLAMTGRQVLPCYAAWLTTDMGDPAYDGAGVTMEISDDAGVSFFDAGTVTVTLGAARPELSWYSLGQIQAPGRLFKITDDGAIARIDSMEMNDPDDKDTSD
jgi:hypothetical protein